MCAAWAFECCSYIGVFFDGRSLPRTHNSNVLLGDLCVYCGVVVVLFVGGGEGEGGRGVVGVLVDGGACTGDVGGVLALGLGVGFAVVTVVAAAAAAVVVLAVFGLATLLCCFFGRGCNYDAIIISVFRCLR